MKVAVALLALTAGCASIGADKVPGWPQLQVIEHHVFSDEIRARCGRYVEAGYTVFACAEFDFSALRCTIWLNSSFQIASIVEHERRHCAGYDHVGESTMQTALLRWKAAQ